MWFTRLPPTSNDRNLPTIVPLVGRVSSETVRNVTCVRTYGVSVVLSVLTSTSMQNDMVITLLCIRRISMEETSELMTMFIDIEMPTKSVDIIRDGLEFTESIATSRNEPKYVNVSVSDKTR